MKKKKKGEGWQRKEVTRSDEKVQGYDRKRWTEKEVR